MQDWLRVQSTHITTQPINANQCDQVFLGLVDHDPKLDHLSPYSNRAIHVAGEIFQPDKVLPELPGSVKFPSDTIEAMKNKAIAYLNLAQNQTSELIDAG